MAGFLGDGGGGGGGSGGSAGEAPARADASEAPAASNASAAPGPGGATPLEWALAVASLACCAALALSTSNSSSHKKQSNRRTSGMETPSSVRCRAMTPIASCKVMWRKWMSIATMVALFTHRSKHVVTRVGISISQTQACLNSAYGRCNTQHATSKVAHTQSLTSMHVQLHHRGTDLARAAMEDDHFVLRGHLRVHRGHECMEVLAIGPRYEV